MVEDSSIKSSEDLRNEYALSVGHISVAWNQLHATLFFWFQRILKLREESTKSLWECGGMDAKQRNMLRAIINETKNDELSLNIKWILDQADELGTYRNTLIHTTLAYDVTNSTYVGFSGVTKNNLIEKHKNIKKHDLFDDIHKNIDSLCKYSMGLFGHYCTGAPGPFPSRPSLKPLPK